MQRYILKLHQYSHDAVNSSTVSFPHAPKARLPSNIPDLWEKKAKTINNNLVT